MRNEIKFKNSWMRDEFAGLLHFRLVLALAVFGDVGASDRFLLANLCNFSLDFIERNVSRIARRNRYIDDARRCDENRWQRS
jgi:hypothetical protein